MSDGPASTPITDATIDADGLDVAYLSCGDGPLAVCLHGFPDTPHSWRHLLPALADAGYRAVAPYLRGYAPTAVPADGAYQTGALAHDAVALHEALDGDGDAVLIGHDWGAFATYGAAAVAPERWRRVVAMSVPPAAALTTGMLTPTQLARSWYIWFFQMPGLPEMVVPADDMDFIDHLWRTWSPGHDPAADTPAVKAALADPANLTAALGYYRAMFDPSVHQERYAAAQAATQQPTPQPTLYLHGRNDGCLGVEMVGDAVAAALPHPASRVEIVDDAGHFLQVERPDVVNRLVCDFLTATD
ncbi:MAG: alpha/beta hydrolase [Acidimicrobiia bacterium]|nr:alpha/beta hydrolase [Acidimicrobiia bacterium]